MEYKAAFILGISQWCSSCWKLFKASSLSDKFARQQLHGLPSPLLNQHIPVVSFIVPLLTCGSISIYPCCSNLTSHTHNSSSASSSCQRAHFTSSSLPSTYFTLPSRNFGSFLLVEVDYLDNHNYHLIVSSHLLRPKPPPVRSTASSEFFHHQRRMIFPPFPHLLRALMLSAFNQNHHRHAYYIVPPLPIDTLGNFSS